MTDHEIIAEISQKIDSLKSENATLQNMYRILSEQKCAVDEELERYRKAERSGYIKRLPCKIGQKVFMINMDEFVNENVIEEFYVDNVIICDDGEMLLKYDSYDGVICTADTITKKVPYLGYYLVFLAREAAEEALKGGASE